MKAYPFLKPGDGGVILAIRVQPRSSRNAVVGVHGEALKIAVNAPPVDGAANEAVVELLAGVFGVPRRNVEILSGDSGRLKRVALVGLTVERAVTTLEKVLS
ncbi:MAG: YggU family protein [Bdellovibrionales bacterium]|nr:YggU family protein [Bdellovibrionales bacterium]